MTLGKLGGSGGDEQSRGAQEAQGVLISDRQAPAKGLPGCECPAVPAASVISQKRGRAALSPC